MRHKKLVLRVEMIRQCAAPAEELTILRGVRGGAVSKSRGNDCSVDGCDATRQCTHPC
jgi:hypothetical protein